jgi:hypothetical protein
MSSRWKSTIASTRTQDSIDVDQAGQAVTNTLFAHTELIQHRPARR